MGKVDEVQAYRLLTKNGIPTLIGQNVEETEEEKSQFFAPMLNGTATNKLATIGRSATPSRVNPLANNEATIENGDFKVFIEKYSDKKSLKVGTVKLLDLLAVELAKVNHFRSKDTGSVQTTVTFSLDDYMGYLGIPNPETASARKEARKRLKEALETIYSTSLEWEERSGKEIKSYAKMRICEAQGIKRGVVTFSFTQSMANYLNQSYIMQYPLKLLAIGERNPNAYPIARKLALHHSIDNNHKRGTSNIISVSKLLESAPDIPTFDEVKNSNRAWGSRIKDRLEKALDEIAEGGVINWEYSNSKGTPLTDRQLDIPDYETFIKLYIKFEMLDSPDPTERLDRKQARLKTRKKAKKAEG